MRHFFQSTFIIFFLLAVNSCVSPSNSGNLLIQSPSEGTYELYRISSESPLQLISESRGSYNVRESLEVGQYLIMADCSYKTVIIKPNEEIKLISHDIEFIKPSDLGTTNNLTIQCHRFTKNHTTQKIKGRFKLKVLDGSHEILVAMKPLHFDFAKLSPEQEPSIIRQQLSAIRVQPIEGFDAPSKYFISPVSELLSITNFQKSSEWFLLLAGKYVVELNGSKKEVEIEEGESLSLDTSTVKVDVSKKIPLELSKRVLGKPQFVKLNGDHLLNLNEEYLVLPGDIELQLNGSIRAKNFKIESGQRYVIQTNSVVVNFKCKAWDYECLGRKKVFLYKKGVSFPFAVGRSDIALLYFEKDAFVSLQGSKNVRYYLSGKKRNHRLNAGYIKFVPVYKSRSQYFTDLTRIETISKNFSGDSIDFPITGEHKIPLITGLYSLAQYNSTMRGDFDRQKNSFNFFVSKDKERSVNYQVNLTERKYKYYMKKQSKRSKSRKKISRKNIGRLAPSLRFQ